MAVFFLYTLLATAAFPWTVSACNYHTSNWKRAEEGAAKFGYDPESATQFWHTLAPENFLCLNGTKQAPSVLSSTATPTLAASELKVDIPAAQNVLFENLGTTVEVVINGTMTAEGLNYNLKQFHFHISSEHVIDGVRFAMEMHNVFQTEAEEVAVLSFLFDVVPTAEVPVIDTLGPLVSQIGQPEQTLEVPSIDMAQFLAPAFAADSKFFSLSQSLTTPPCTEGVQWYISTKPIPISAQTLSQFQQVIKFNSRPVQQPPA